MRVIKKIIKASAVLFLVLIIGLAALDIYLIKKPEVQAKRKIAGIDEISSGINELSLREDVKEYPGNTVEIVADMPVQTAVLRYVP